MNLRIIHIVRAAAVINKLGSWFETTNEYLFWVGSNVENHCCCRGKLCARVLLLIIFFGCIFRACHWLKRRCGPIKLRSKTSRFATPFKVVKFSCDILEIVWKLREVWHSWSHCRWNHSNSIRIITFPVFSSSNSVHISAIVRNIELFSNFKTRRSASSGSLWNLANLSWNAKMHLPTLG